MVLWLHAVQCNRDLSRASVNMSRAENSLGDEREQKEGAYPINCRGSPESKSSPSGRSRSGYFPAACRAEVSRSVFATPWEIED